MTTSTLVILHGWGLSEKKFEPLVLEFKKRKYSIYSLDFPGFGDEKAPVDPWTVTDYAKFLYRKLQEKDIINPILIGHSFGGRVSLRYSTLYPKNVRALILSGTPGFTPIPRQKILIFVSLAKIGKFIFSLPVLSLFLDKIRTWYYYLVGAKEFNRAEGSMKETFKNVVKESLVDDMKKVTVPCLLLWGINDTIVPVSIADRMVKTIPHAKKIVIPEADHGVPFKEPKKFADEVDKFVNRLS